MALVVGPSGLVVDVADEVASGLVSAGHAEYAEVEKSEPKQDAGSRSRKSKNA